MNRNIVFNTDRNYLIATRVAIKSLVDHCRTDDCQYSIYCIAKGLIAVEKEQIKSLGSDNARIVTLDSEELPLYMPDISLAKHDCSANVTALTKFDLPVIFSDLDQILYLDGDIVINGSIKDIFLTDLGDNYVAAVLDAGGMYTREVQKRIVENIYFNSGVMLLNLKKMRADKIREKLYQSRILSNDVSLMDQNIFNEVLRGRIIVLPLEYNCMYVSIIRAKHFRGLKLDAINDYYGSKYTSWKEIGHCAKIIHYATMDKPWKYSDITAVSLWDKIYQTIGEEKINRRKIYLKQLYSMCGCKYLRLPAFLLWELRVLGFRKTMRDIKRVLLDNQFSIRKIFMETCK